MAMHTSSFNTVTGWITHLTSRLVHSLAEDKHNRLAYGGGPHSTIADNGYDKYAKRIFIPNVLARWPWPSRLNQYYSEVHPENTAWVASFNAFSPKVQEAFKWAKINYLACLAYPIAKREHVRTTCDFMSIALVVDEDTDVLGEDEVRKQKSIIMDALHNPHKPRPKGEWVGGEIHRQFWERTIPHASAQSQKRFMAAYDAYLEGVVQQAIDRSGHRIRDIQSYFDVRRHSVGTAPAFTLLELGLDIPDEVMSHPTIRDMVMASSDMIILSNDYASYNIEQARGDDGHNIVTIVMHELDTDVNGAMLWVGNHFADIERKFLEAMAAVPKWGEPIDSQVKEYCNGLGNWARANDDWNFESERYFGSRGLEIKRKRWMFLMPKEGPRETVRPVLVNSQCNT